MSTSSSNSKFRNTKEAPTEPFKRSVASCLKAIAKSPELEVTFAAERPGLAPGKARLPEPARKMTKRDAAIVRGHADLHRAQDRLSRCKAASQADARQSAGARRVRGGRAGPRRGDRRAPHGGRCEKPHRDARRSFPSRQVRRNHRPCRCAAGGCAGDAGARAPDRHGAAHGGEEDGRSLAAHSRGQDRQAARPARWPGRGPDQVRRRRA